MAKPKCKCQTHGCAHFGCGNCRISEKKCVMDIRRYHFACCPFLGTFNDINRPWRELAEEYSKRRFK